MSPILMWILRGAAVGLILAALEKGLKHDIQGDLVAGDGSRRRNRSRQPGSQHQRSGGKGGVSNAVVDHSSADQPRDNRSREPVRPVQDGAPEVAEPEGDVAHGKTTPTETPAPSGKRPVQETPENSAPKPQGGAPPNPSPANPETVVEE